HEFGLDPVAIGVLFSAYSWTYVLANLPGGWVVDRFGSRVMYAVALLTWSSFTLLQGFAGRFATLFGLRLGVGIAEAPTFPINNRVVSIWFAQRERGIATSVYLVGQYVGMAALTNLSGIVTPIAIGFIVRETGSFGWALGLISVFAVIGALCYTFLLGEVKRIELDPPATGGSAPEPLKSTVQD
ncbi:MFS transporter, partial [Burkholderia cenocepacia]|nr:MFS transporter [Burkholderia cenocepacia]